MEAEMIAAKDSRMARIGLLALGAGALTAATQGEGDRAGAEVPHGPVRCEIQVTPLDGGIELQGMVFAQKPVQGRYALQVASSGQGRSNINQAGRFSASPDVPVKLGSIRLGGGSSSYRARLKVSWNGEEISCEKTVGGGWL
jgi:CsgH protein